MLPRSGGAKTVSSPRAGAAPSPHSAGTAACPALSRQRRPDRSPPALSAPAAALPFSHPPSAVASAAHTVWAEMASGWLSSGSAGLSAPRSAPPLSSPASCGQCRTSTASKIPGEEMCGPVRLSPVCRLFSCRFLAAAPVKTGSAAAPSPAPRGSYEADLQTLRRLRFCLPLC